MKWAQGGWATYRRSQISGTSLALSLDSFPQYQTNYRHGNKTLLETAKIPLKGYVFITHLEIEPKCKSFPNCGKALRNVPHAFTYFKKTKLIPGL